MLNVIRKKEGFAILYLTILILAVVFAFSISIVVLIHNEQKISRNLIKANQSYFVAEAGIEDAIYRIINFMNISSNYTLTVGNNSADISTNSPNQENWIITANGNVDNDFRKLEVRLTITNIRPQFFYGAQAGDLGIVMENNSRIEGAGGVAGNVYSNGPIDGDVGATITGDAFVATGMSEDQSHIVYNSDQIFGQVDPVIDIAQSFKSSVSNTLTKVSVYIKKVGNPGDAAVKILTDSSGTPSKTSLASATLQSSLVGTSYGWVDIVFSTPPNLTAGTTYWVMIDASKNNSKYWSWGKDMNRGYGNGIAMYTEDWNAGSPTWIEIIGDLNFKTFMGGQATFLEDVIVSGNAHANTIYNSKICGDAYFQIIDANSLNFLNNPSEPTCSAPLTPGTAYPGSTDPPLENMPLSESNINQWKQEATDGGVDSGDLVIDSDTSYGPRKIEGNLIMTSNNKTLTVTGTLYVTGYIDISNGSAIRCSPAYNLYGCIVVADQWVHITNNGIFQGSGQPGSYLMILSTSNCDGTSSVNCTDYNAAMDLHNNAAGAIFYANDGLIYIHNGVQVSELTAKKIDLEQNAVISYEQGLINSSFSAGPGGGWQVTSWKEVE